MDGTTAFARPAWLEAGFTEAEFLAWWPLGVSLDMALYARQKRLTPDDLRRMSPTERERLARESWRAAPWTL